MSPQRINALVKKGRIPVNAQKKIPLAEGMAALEMELDPAWERKAGTTGGAADTAHPAETGGEQPAVRNTPAESSARNTLLDIRAQNAKFDLDVKRGMYLPKRDIEDAMVTCGQRIRQQLDVIDGWADEIYALALKADAAELRRLLKTKKRKLQQDAADAMSLLAGEDAAGADTGDDAGA